MIFYREKRIKCVNECENIQKIKYINIFFTKKL